MKKYLQLSILAELQRIYPDQNQRRQIETCGSYALLMYWENYIRTKIKAYSNKRKITSKINNMKYSILLIALFLTTSFVYSQIQKSQLEINPYLRWDGYPKFSYAINSINTNAIKINGTSWGIITAYKLPIHNKLYLRAGLGYYRYSFNKIENNNSSYGKSDARVINYIGLGDVIFRTNKYWYNTIAANIGVERNFMLRNDMQIVCGLSVNNYYTYSQYYRITHKYPTGPPNHKYLTRKARHFGFSTNIYTGITKKIGKASIGPSFIIPIYNLWKQDEIFPQEEDSKTRSKWINGMGIGIICNYSLGKK